MSKTRRINRRKYIGGSVNPRIFVLWLGNEPMNSRRKHAMTTMPEGHVLITKDNLSKYILPDHPIHPAYQYLSTIHKSDYIRAYLMHHYGGGYTDVKSGNYNWDTAFEKMNANPHIMIMGTKSKIGDIYSGIEDYDENVKNKLFENKDKLITMCYLICRSHSPITKEWYSEVNKKLDNYLERLKQSPAKHTRESYNNGLRYALPAPRWEINVKSHAKNRTNYPISWNILLAQTLYPILLKHLDNIDNTTLSKN